MAPAAPLPPLRVHKSIGGGAGPLDYAIAAVIHCMLWGGGMIVGPLLLLSPTSFLVLSFRKAAALTGLTAVLALLPPLRESPRFCRVFLRAAALLKGGSTLWVADEVLPHLGDGLMVCYHPHGVIPLGFTLNGAIRAKTGKPKDYLPLEAQISSRVNGVQAPILFKIPILRQVLQLFGCSTPATKQGMLGLLKRQMTFGIIIGGSEEVALQLYGRERLFLRNRAGFIKYALQHGTKLVIAYNYGESDLYTNVEAFRSFNLWLVRTCGFVLPFFWGQWWCPLLPRGDVPLNTVFGKVLELPRIEEPTAEQVAEWHGRYIEALQGVFGAYKEQFGYRERTLEIL